MHYDYDDDECIISHPSNISEEELDTIIRLIPHASPRQTEVIEGQIQIHKKLTQIKEYKK